MATPTALPKVDWDTVAGYEDLKREIDELLEPFLGPRIRERLELVRIPLPKGILLYGPPGTGKTLIAKAIATRLDRPFFHVAGAHLLSQWVGGGSGNDAGLPECPGTEAQRHLLRCLLPSRQNLSPSTGGGQVSANVVGIFLSQMDGVIPLDDMLVVAATNQPKQVDPAALRPGRFDQILYIAPPDPAARRAIFLSHLQGRPGAEAIDMDALVEVSARYTGADIAGAINGAYRANRGAPVTTEQLVTVLTIHKPTVTLSMLKEYEALRDEYSRTDHLVEARAVTTPTRYTWNDIGGLKQVKEGLRRMVEQHLLHPDLYKTYGVRPPRGISEVIAHGGSQRPLVTGDILAWHTRPARFPDSRPSLDHFRPGRESRKRTDRKSDQNTAPPVENVPPRKSVRAGRSFSAGYGSHWGGGLPTAFGRIIPAPSLILNRLSMELGTVLWKNGNGEATINPREGPPWIQ